MQRSVLVSALAVSASLAAWCGTASAHYASRHIGPPAPQTHDRYNNDHKHPEYWPDTHVYGYYSYCCEYYVRPPSYYRPRHYRYDYYRPDHYRSDRYRYRRWHRDEYDD